MSEIKMYCPMCETERAFRAETRQEEYELRGEKFVLEVPRLVCLTCGEAEIGEAFGDPTLKLYAEYRRRHGLLSPEQIRAIREKYDLSQEAFATLLGTSPATLARYEGGSLQDKAYDQLLRACENPWFMSDLLRREGERLSPRQRTQVEAALANVRAECVTEQLLQWWRASISLEKIDIQQPDLPQIVEFARRTDRLAALSESRRVDLFFLAAIASADDENPVEPFVRYSRFSSFHLRGNTILESRSQDLSAPSAVPVQHVFDPRGHSVHISTHSVNDLWPRQSEIRLLRRWATRLEHLGDDEAHRSVVQFASKRLLKSRWLTEWTTGNDWACGTLFPLPAPKPLLALFDSGFRPGNVARP